MAKAITLSLQGGGRLENKIRAMAHKLGTGASVRVGFLEGAKYPNGLSVAQVAFWQEFGTPAAPHPIPPRPFMRTTVETKSPGWGDSLARIAVKTDYDAHATMSLMGEGIKGQFQRSINEWKDPPLSPYTIARKGHSKPLIETATMLRAVDYEVNDGA